MFPLALLCLLFSSCTKEYLLDNDNIQTETRTSVNISVMYTLPNGSETTVECLKIESSAVNADTLSVKIYMSLTSYTTINVQSLSISGINGDVKCTNGSGNIYNNLNNVKILPYSSTQVKLVISNNNIVISNSFIGEDTDGC